MLRQNNKSMLFIQSSIYTIHAARLLTLPLVILDWIIFALKNNLVNIVNKIFMFDYLLTLYIRDNRVQSLNRERQYSHRWCHHRVDRS